MRLMMVTVGVAAALAAPPALAQDQASVRAFLADIYRPYGSEKQQGPSLDHPRRWFEPVLAEAMRRDASQAARRGEVGALDGDPFCDCQDFERFTAKIGPITLAKGSARAVVRFRNGRPMTLVYDLVSTRAGWRIRDISWPEGHLRGLFFKHR